MAELDQALSSPLIDGSSRLSVAQLLVSSLIERSAGFARLIDIRKKVSGLEVCYDYVLTVQGLGQSQRRRVFQPTEKGSR